MKKVRITKKASKNTGRVQAARNNSELLNWDESQSAPPVNLEMLDIIEKGSGRRSTGRK